MSTKIDADKLVETAARYIGNEAVLYVDHNGTWSVGTRGQSVEQYVRVKVGNQTQINDDSYEVTALAVEKAGDGYTAYVQSNDDLNAFWAVSLDSQGNVGGVQSLDKASLFAAEKRLGADLNDNGGIGEAAVLVAEGDANLYADGSGYLFLQAGTQQLALLNGAGAKINMYDAENFGIEAIIAGSNGYEVFATNDSGTVFKLNVVSAIAATPATGAQKMVFNGVSDNTQSAVIQAVSSLSANETAALEASTGKNLDGKGNLAVTAGWSSSLKTTAIRQAVDSALQNSSKIDHAGLVKIVDAALGALTQAGASTVGADTVSDLRALAARGSELFTAKDLSDQETGYLDYVFNAMVNTSLANRFYTGGSTTSQSLGNLSADSSLDVLQKLENKWLLGKDLSNPTTEGDTANPNAKAASGVYKLQSGALFVDGVSVQDVQQGSAGDCYLIAALASVAQGKGTALKSTLVENGSSGEQSTWGVRLYDANGASHWVTVNNQFAFSDAQSSQTSYAKARVSQGTAELWVALLEKAYVQANELEILKRGNGQDGKNAFFAIEGGMADPFVTFLGGKATNFTSTPEGGFSNAFTQSSTVADVSAALTQALNGGKLIWLGSSVATKNSLGSSLFVSGHAFMLYDADPNNSSNTSVKVFNPWGWSPEDTTQIQSHVTPFDADLVNIVGNSGFTLVTF